MKRAEVAHVVRAAQAITNEREFVLVGSQAAHLQLEQMPDIMQMSGELDIYPLRKPELAELIDGALGEGSPFHETFGYYAHGIGPETARLPTGWERRAVRVSAPSMDKAIAIAPEIHDICASKAIAGREKDHAYVMAAISTKIIDPTTLVERIEMTDRADPDLRNAAKAWVASLSSRSDHHR
ncbi:DUF6036 family nucleotidyltransferase [Marivita sp.]|uniref:DUF6036 family nucleotidyltransferase n=1 Tax=Marivita sp. TaxID=2003365 RepID=UPI0025C70628|nr:DUF6036 family nucleotidyltransferase [Marivita sp.]